MQSSPYYEQARLRLGVLHARNVCYPIESALLNSSDVSVPGPGLGGSVVRG
jgi:hypothetical protein